MMRVKNFLCFKLTLVRVALFLSLFFVAFSCDQADFVEPYEVEEHPVVRQEEQTDAVVLSPYFEGHLLIAHRGLPDYPENTYVSVDAAVAKGFKAVECDICMTADSVFVLSHDMDIARCSNGKGRVNDMTYEQLLAYDFGSWKGRQFVGEKIARLDDLLDYFKEKGLIIELDLADETRFKRQWIPPLYELVKRKGMLGQTMFTATQDEFSDFLSESRDIVISVSGVTNMTTAQRALPMSKNVLLCNYSIHYNNLTDKIVDYAHTNGIKVKTWTIVSESKLRECVDIGVDYIITELPPEPWPWEDEGQTSIIPIMAD